MLTCLHASDRDQNLNQSPYPYLQGLAPYFDRLTEKEPQLNEGTRISSSDVFMIDWFGSFTYGCLTDDVSRQGLKPWSLPPPLLKAHLTCISERPVFESLLGKMTHNFRPICKGWKYGAKIKGRSRPKRFYP